LTRYTFRKKRMLALAAAADAAGRFLLRGRPVRKTPISPKKILLIRLDHLGDLLPATALPQLLKENFPGAQVHFVTNEAGEALLRNNPYVDRVWPFEPGWFVRGKRKAFGMKYGALVRALRREKIDLAFSLRGDVRENWFLRRAGVHHAIGFGITGGGFLLDREAVYVKDVHESQHTLDLLRYAGVNASELEPRIYFSEEEEEKFKRDMRSWGMEPGRWIGFQADAGTEAKEWPLENLDALIAGCENWGSGARIVFVGSDPFRARWLEKRLGEHKNRITLMGKTDLRQLFYVLKSVRSFVGPDSGPAHIAASFGHPTLFLYSGTNVVDQWRPMAENARLLRYPVPCSPCHLTVCPVKGHPCMSQIKPHDVLLWLKEHAHAG
jgi:ADP-heptose:LPS heptosyltransferase